MGRIRYGAEMHIAGGAGLPDLSGLVEPGRQSDSMVVDHAVTALELGAQMDFPFCLTGGKKPD